MNCYICDGPAVGMCGQCDRFYCSRHAGQPVAGKKASCKVCDIGAQDRDKNNEADRLVQEITDACGGSRYEREIVLSQEQAIKLLNSLLFILSDSPNRWARMQVTYALSCLARESRWAESSSPIYHPAHRAKSALLETLNDQDYWVRFAAVERLVQAECLEAIRPIIRLWEEKGIEAFPTNGIQKVRNWARDDKEAGAEVHKVYDELEKVGKEQGDGPEG